jgi:hypothetical protein
MRLAKAAAVAEMQESLRPSLEICSQAVMRLVCVDAPISSTIDPQPASVVDTLDPETKETSRVFSRFIETRASPLRPHFTWFDGRLTPKSQIARPRFASVVGPAEAASC